MLSCTFMGYTYIWGRPGRGGLARIGEFWYPVRLIESHADEKWLVRWWRGCSFDPDNTGTVTVAPGSITAVPEDDIVDSLWGDRGGRRKIRVRKIDFILIMTF